MAVVLFLFLSFFSHQGRTHPSWFPIPRPPFRVPPFRYVPEPPSPPTVRHGSRRVLGVRVGEASLRTSFSSALSTACSLGQFNQRWRGRYYVALMVKGRPTYFGFARPLLNLRDHTSHPPHTFYLFEGDGTASCRVHAFGSGQEKVQVLR